MKQYHDLLQSILNEHDTNTKERTGTGTISRFGEMIKFDLREGFPAITTKKLAWKAVVSELLWFLSGSSNLYDLRAKLHGEENRYNGEKKTIWDGNYYKQAKDLGYSNGEMGAIYGTQWRNFGYGEVNVEPYSHDISGVDQVKMVLEEAMKNPQSRRLIVNTWNPFAIWDNIDSILETPKATLPPCHVLYQLNITEDGYLDVLWFQRSVDTFLGLAFNIASYALLTHMFAQVLGLTPRYLIGQLGNVHIYDNHIDQVKEQLTRTEFPLPTLNIKKPLTSIIDLVYSKVEDFELVGYQHHATIKAPMAV